MENMEIKRKQYIELCSLIENNQMKDARKLLYKHNLITNYEIVIAGLTYSPLIEASKHNDFKMMELLIRKGASVNLNYYSTNNYLIKKYSSFQKNKFLNMFMNYNLIVVKKAIKTYKYDKMINYLKDQIK